MSSRYKVGDYVEFLEKNEWSLGYVTSISALAQVSYTIQSMQDGRLSFHRAKNMRPSHLNLGDDDMPMPEQPAEPPAPGPVGKKRFATTGDSALKDMEMAAKARNTHRQTAWGIKTFRGNYFH